MKNQYRISTDHWLGYEVQVKRWWFPFWMQCCGKYGMSTNTFSSLEEAKNHIHQMRNGINSKIVWREGEQ